MSFVYVAADRDNLTDRRIRLHQSPLMDWSDESNEHHLTRVAPVWGPED